MVFKLANHDLIKQLLEICIFTIVVMLLFIPVSMLLSKNANSSQLVEKQSVNANRQSELKNILLQDCGSCHGMTLKGGLGPALTKDIVSSLPRELVYFTISEGREGTPMPPWKNILAKNEINWIVDTLYEGVNDEK